MRAVTFQAPGEVRVDERPEPELLAADDAVIRITATGVCGSDLHIYHGRNPMDPGTTIGHEYVGVVEAIGDGVTNVKAGDRVLGAFHVACGLCHFCRQANFHRCDFGRTFGHGKAMGDLNGTQADMALVPHANLTLRPVPDGLSDDIALFAGDVMATGYHATAGSGVQPGDVVAVLGLGPVGLCAVQGARVAGAAHVIAVDTVAERLEMARRFGAQAVHLTEEDPRAAVKAATEGRGADVVVEAVGSSQALDLAILMAAKCGTLSLVGVAQPGEVRMNLLWFKSLNVRSGLSNVIAHMDHVLALLGSGDLDPAPLVTHHMSLDDAPEAYDLYAQHQALKIVLTP